MERIPPDPGSRNRSRSQDLLFGQEEQNKNLARELHDVVSQRLAAVRMEIDLLEKSPPQANAALRARLRKLSGQVGQLAHIMHEIAHQLHPAILEDLGLVAALRGECQVFSELYGSPIQFDALHVPPDITDDVALCLYRIAQESLRNVARHAPGAAVSVILSGSAGEISLRVEDTGPGFRQSAGRRQGLGLISMRERARLVNGKLQVRSRIGKGTVIEVQVPVSAGRPRARRARGHAAG